MYEAHRRYAAGRWAILAGAALLMASLSAGAEEELTVRTKDPAFRTDFAMHLALGGNSCVGGGTNYANCKGLEHAWDTGFGIAGGLFVRPFRFFSAGLDVAYTMLVYHQETSSKWGDLTLGPALRVHFPVKLRKIYIEPNVGLHGGWVKGNYHQGKRDNDTVNYDHTHMGAFMSLLFGADVFLLPKLGVGLEFRVIRTFYIEVCFESDESVNCRGDDDQAIIERYAEHTGYPGEKGTADYPWKLFYGIHGLYYF
jgi:hypothetical protein